jgi:ABC-type polysaccharide/polyol phosphate export permease
MLSAVYFLLIVIIGGSGGSTRYGHLTASLFLFYLVSNSLSGGVKSVTAGQRLILNTAFPRMMLPISATVIAFFKFIPTLLVFMIMRTLLGLPFGWKMLWSIPIILIALIFSLGVAILISTVNVYFRDIASFLPYLTRTFLYLSPILYEASALKPEFRVFQYFNPLFSILESWSLSIVHAQTPQLSSMLTALAWALGFLLVGTYFFLSREREFAVRL